MRNDLPTMKTRSMLIIATIAVVLAVVGAIAKSAQDKYTLQVPNGLAFSEFKGYENWQVVSVSQTADLLKVMVANPTMIDAYRSRRSRQRQAVPRRLQDREDRVETEKEGGGAFCRERAGHLAGRFSHREGQQAIPGHEGMGIRGVRLCPRVRHVHAEPDRHRQLRFRVPYDRGEQGLHFSLVSEAVREALFDQADSRRFMISPSLRHRGLSRSGLTIGARAWITANGSRCSSILSNQSAAASISPQTR